MCVCVCRPLYSKALVIIYYFCFVIKVQGHLYCALFTGFVWGRRGCTDVIALQKKNIKAYWFAACMESHIKAPLLMLNSRRTSQWWKWWKHENIVQWETTRTIDLFEKKNFFLPFTSRPMSNKQPSQPSLTPEETLTPPPNEETHLYSHTILHPTQHLFKVKRSNCQFVQMFFTYLSSSVKLGLHLGWRLLVLFCLVSLRAKAHVNNILSNCRTNIRGVGPDNIITT